MQRISTIAAPARGLVAALAMIALGALPANASDQTTVSGVRRRDGGALGGAATADFATGAETITGIADTHANINALIAQSVTVLGQVFVRGGTVTGTPSGFIQDGTGRGLNVFGGTLPNAADSPGVVVKVTGTPQLFFTTVELVNPVIVGVARGVPDLGPRALTVPQASSAQWEGTYIQTTATLTGSPTASGSSHYSYPAIASGTAFTFRVWNATGINPGSTATFAGVVNRLTSLIAGTATTPILALV